MSEQEAPNKLEFEIEFLSDYHVGAGYGLGMQVDSALLRDGDNVPVIRGTMLAGLLREALVNLLTLKPLQSYQSCQSGNQEDDGPAYCRRLGAGGALCPVCRIFGSPRHPKPWHFSSARPVRLTSPQQNGARRWVAGETGAQTVMRVRVNPRTRRAEDNKLFSCEIGDGSLRFHFTAEYSGAGQTLEEDAVLLLAAARMVRKLGAGKHRGQGECSIHLKNSQLEQQLLQHFEAMLQGKAPSSAASSTSTYVQSMPAPAIGQPHSYRLHVLLRTDEPLLLARRLEAGNQYETSLIVPGVTLRGACAWRVAHRFGATIEAPESAQAQDFVALFFQDALSFSHLYPVQISAADPQQGYLALPAPRDLVTCAQHLGYPPPAAERGHGVWSQAWDGPPPDSCPLCTRAGEASAAGSGAGKLETIDGFITLNPVAPSQNFTPRRRSEMHISIDPTSHRVRSGDLFGYTALDAGQFFAGEITCTDAQVWEALRAAAGLMPLGQPSELRLGKATRRGHGKVTLWFSERDAPPWQNAPLEQRVTTAEQVILTLLSETIVVDAWGRYARGFDAGWLQRWLRLPGAAGVKVEPERRFSQTRTIDAFQGKLGLPRWRDEALAAGSTVKLQFTGITLAELQPLLKRAESEGVGLRREEGYGRVGFNLPFQQSRGMGRQTGYEDWRLPAIDLEPLQLGDEADNDPATRIARFTAAWRMKLEARLSPERSEELFKDARFEAAARLLHLAGTTSEGDAIPELEHLGEVPFAPDGDVEGREKKNFFKDKGKNSVAVINELRGEMKKLLDTHGVDDQLRARLWREGMIMLAEVVAKPARKQAERGG